MTYFPLVLICFNITLYMFVKENLYFRSKAFFLVTTHFILFLYEKDMVLPNHLLPIL